MPRSANLKMLRSASLTMPRSARIDIHHPAHPKLACVEFSTSLYGSVCIALVRTDRKGSAHELTYSSLFCEDIACVLHPRSCDSV